MLTSVDGLNKGDPIAIINTGVPGIVANKPKAGSGQVRVLLSGQRTPAYRLVHELRTREMTEADPLPAAPVVPRAIQGRVSRFEAAAKPVSEPNKIHPEGRHTKSYLVTYVSMAGKFTVERVAAIGISMAIELFYLQFKEVAIVSIVCVL